MLVNNTGGGGGYGDPFERDPDRVAADVRNGFVSIEAALCDYGVQVHPETFEVDLEARTARLHVPGVLDTRVEPIKNKVTGALHRARIALPFGKEFALAEVASGSTRATGKVPLESTNTHAHVVHNRLTAQGVAPEPQG